MAHATKATISHAPGPRLLKHSLIDHLSEGADAAARMRENVLCCMSGSEPPNEADENGECESDNDRSHCQSECNGNRRARDLYH
jgi:hypothetical protein